MNPDHSFLRTAAPLLAVLVALGGCAKSGGKPEPKADPGINAKLETIRQAGQPVTPAELNAWYPEPAAGENAAPLYAEAFAALVVTDAKSPSFLAKNQAALPLLHKAAAKTQCRYPIDFSEGASVRLPHLVKVRNCVELLARDTTANAGKGRMDLAAQSVMDGLRMARSLEQEPLIISQRVRVAAESIALSGLQGALNAKPFPEEWLIRLQAVVREGEGSLGPSLARACTGERCVALGWFQMTPQEYDKLVANAGTNAPFGSLAEFERYRRQPEFNTDLNLCLDCFSNWLAVASLPLPASLDAASQCSAAANDLVSDAKAKGCRLSPLILPELGSSIEKAADSIAQSRSATAALALERYRLANANALPDSLRQLVPTYLSAVPDDPYDGKALRYKKLSPRGYVVYSIGRNRQDDGGAAKPPGGKADGPYDVAFAVRR